MSGGIDKLPGVTEHKQTDITYYAVFDSGLTDDEIRKICDENGVKCGCFGKLEKYQAGDLGFPREFVGRKLWALTPEDD